jgi:hypothetical protein
MMQRTYSSSTSRDGRIAIQTALKFKIPYSIIQEVLGVTRCQIQYARITQLHHRSPSPQEFSLCFKWLLRCLVKTFAGPGFVVCFQYFKGDKKEEPKDVELASQTESEDGTST